MIYRILCGLLGLFMVLGGLAFFVAFFQFHAPGGEGLPDPMSVGVYGMYFVAFTGACMVAWGGCLLGAMRRPEAAPWIAGWTALGLALNAVYRLMVWVVGDYHAMGELPRVEAALFLLLALALLWTRPTAAPTPETA